jgi:hypothetical protein
VPWPVYSERLLSTGVMNAWQDFVVPPGTRAVAKWVSAAHWGAAVGELHVQIANAYVYWHYFPADMSVVNVPVLAIAYAGERISVMQMGDSMQTHVSGFLFADPSGRAGHALELAGEADGPAEPHPGPWS